MPRSRSRSRSPTRPYHAGARAQYTPGKGWAFVVSILGAAVAEIPITAAGLKAVAVGVGLMSAAGLAVAGVVAVSAGLYSWATSGSSNATPQVTPELIQEEKQMERMDPSLVHVAICGTAGSGKTSIVNALRGLRNNHPDAARTGTVETTTSRTSYPAHTTINSLILHDCPGAGTLRVPAEDYYTRQKLYLFDCVLIVQGERLGELELATIKNCIRHQKLFILLRSRSDEIIRRLADDDDLATDKARAKHIRTTVEAFYTEFRRAGLPEPHVEELLRRCAIVNKNDLRILTETNASDWSETGGETEIYERILLRALGKVGTWTQAGG